MVINREIITTEALTLPPDQRMTLACRLLESVEPTPTQEVETAWENEIARRIARFHSGESVPVPVSEVFAMLDQIAPDHG